MSVACSFYRSVRSTITAVAILGVPAHLSIPADAQEVPIFKAETALMEVEVRVTDGQGGPVADLSKADFELSENGISQEIATFEFVRRADAVQPRSEPAPSAPSTEAASAKALEELRGSTFIYIATRGRRQDSMNIYGAVKEFIDENLGPGVLVSLNGSPFTTRASELDERLREMLQGNSPNDTGSLVDTLTVDLARDFEPSPAFQEIVAELNEELGTQMDAIEDRSAFYRRLRMYEYIDLIHALSIYPGRKIVVLFSTGLPIDEDNLDIMDVLEAEATKARVRFFVSDVSGLTALPPGGDAESGIDGTAFLGDVLNNGFSGQATGRQDDQDGLVDLARRTGGRAVLNSNDFGEVFDVVTRESGDYYLLGYYPRDTEKRGRFRRLRVRVGRKGLRVSHQRGYYEEQAFARMSRTERNLQMHQALTFDTPYTDLPLEVDLEYFRNSAGSPTLVYSVGLHTNDIPSESTKKGDLRKLTVIAQASLDSVEGGRSQAPILDDFVMTLRNPSSSSASESADHWLHYGSQMQLPAGSYNWKVIVRDELSGLLGSYQTRVRLPESGADLAASSLLLTGRIVDTGATATEKRKKKAPEDVLQVSGSRFYATSVKAFRKGDPLYLLYDIYNPGAAVLAAAPSPKLALYQGRARVEDLPVTGYQTVPQPEANRLRQLAALSTDGLEAGEYTIAAMLPASGATAPVIVRRFRITPPDQ